MLATPGRLTTRPHGSSSPRSRAAEDARPKRPRGERHSSPHWWVGLSSTRAAGNLLEGEKQSRRSGGCAR